MKSKEFFDLAVKMRYVQKHYYLSTDKETRKAWRRACKAYEKKMDDGFEVLEIPKGTWTEAIFAKAKPQVEKVRMKFADDDELDREDELRARAEEDDDDEDAPEIEDHYNDIDEDDDAFDDDKLTEESYRTTFEDPENLGLDDANDVADDEDY